LKVFFFDILLVLQAAAIALQFGKQPPKQQLIDLVTIAPWNLAASRAFERIPQG